MILKESGNLAERLIKGQVVNAQNAECIYVLKNENQKLKDKIKEMSLESEATNELRRKQLSEQMSSSSEKEQLHEKVNMLLEENSKLRETPDTQRLEEELVQVKMREAEAQLAIKELQKTIHTLNLEYQEFLNNRSAAFLSSLSTSPSTNSPSPNGVNGPATNGHSSKQEIQTLEEELLKVKMREAETQSEMKSMSLKLMQLDTEKQVAYNQIKRQDDEIRKLNTQIQQMQEKELDTKSQLVEYRRQLDNKEAEVKESNMTHKLQEAEDAHVIAELRQRVASLEVQIQEFVTTGQLNDSVKNFNLYNGIASSTDKLVDFNDDMKYMLMSSTTSLASDKFNFFKTHKANSGILSTPSTPTTPAPVNNLHNSINKNGDAQISNSTSLTSIPNTANSSIIESIAKNKSKHLALSRSHSEDAKKTDLTKSFNGVNGYNKANNVINEYLDSDIELDDDLNKSYPSNSSTSNDNKSINSFSNSNLSNNTSKNKDEEIKADTTDDMVLTSNTTQVIDDTLKNGDLNKDNSSNDN